VGFLELIKIGWLIMRLNNINNVGYDCIYNDVMGGDDYEGEK
jgi:hypothetical protein